MKNYKGFEKQPYCTVHYPTQKHTAVSDNPEMLRIKENTKIQSNVSRKMLNLTRQIKIKII